MLQLINTGPFQWDVLEVKYKVGTRHRRRKRFVRYSFEEPCQSCSSRIRWFKWLPTKVSNANAVAEIHIPHEPQFRLCFMCASREWKRGGKGPMGWLQ